MDLPPHGWDRAVGVVVEVEEVEEGGDEGDEGDEEEEEEEEGESSEQQGKGCSVESRIRGVGTWRPGGCGHCAASCGKHGNKGT